jgi:hypothetical protein
MYIIQSQYCQIAANLLDSLLNCILSNYMTIFVSFRHCFYRTLFFGVSINTGPTTSLYFLSINKNLRISHHITTKPTTLFIQITNAESKLYIFSLIKELIC